MTPDCSSAARRREHCEADRPIRSANSLLVSRPSAWRALSSLISNSSMHVYRINLILVRISCKIVGFYTHFSHLLQEFRSNISMLASLRKIYVSVSTRCAPREDQRPKSDRDRWIRVCRICSSTAGTAREAVCAHGLFAGRQAQDQEHHGLSAGPHQLHP